MCIRDRPFVALDCLLVRFQQLFPLSWVFFVLAIASCGGDTERTPQREIYILAGQSNMTESPAGQVGLHDALRTRLSELRPKAEIVLVPTAVGGTHILQWQKGAPLYMSMLSKTRTELQAGGFVAGMFFWQGEPVSYTHLRAHET